MAEKKNGNKEWSEYVCALSHKEKTVEIFQDKCHKCITRIPIIIEGSRDDLSNTVTTETKKNLNIITQMSNCVAVRANLEGVCMCVVYLCSCLPFPVQSCIYYPAHAARAG